MSPLFLLIIGFLCLQYLVTLASNWLNLNAFSPLLPQEFLSCLSPKKYKKTLNYLQDNTVFSLIQSGIFLILTISFLLLQGPNTLDQIARSFNYPEIITGLIFMGMLTGLSTLISIPFSLYHTFVIEQKFGFNQTTLTTFIIDLFKSLFLTVLLGAPIFALLQWFFLNFGSQAWIIAWLTLTIIQLTLMYLAPILIMPIFNKFTPLAKGELSQAINKFAQQQQFTLEGIYTMDGSKRSSKANAFFTGFGKYKRIVLFDTLITKHTTEELVSILAHEIGHYKKHHILKQLLLSIAVSFITFFFLSRLINNQNVFTAFNVGQTSIYMSFFFIALLFSPFSELISIFVNYLSRKYEYQADAYAVTTYKHSKDFTNALKKLSVDSLSNLIPHPIYVFLNYSHPPVLQRIKAINKLAP